MVSLIDMGGRLLPDLSGYPLHQAHYAHAQSPVARVMWQAEPSLTHRCGVLADGGRRPSHGFELRCDGRTDAGLGRHDWKLSLSTTARIPPRNGLEHDLFLSDLAWKLK